MIINPEQASKLKDLGFPQDMYYGVYYYAEESTCPIPFLGTPLVKNFYVAPSLEQVAKWLREEKDIDIEITMDTREEKYKYGRIYIPQVLFCGTDGTLCKLQSFDVVCNSYEEALLAGIDAVIKSELI